MPSDTKAVWRIFRSERREDDLATKESAKDSAKSSSLFVVA